VARSSGRSPDMPTAHPGSGNSGHTAPVRVSNRVVSVPRGLAEAGVLFAALLWSGHAAGQAIYEPAGGQTAQGPAQPVPPLGTTDSFPPFATTGLGFAGAPATYTGAGVPGTGFGGRTGILPVAPAAPPTRLLGGNPLLPPITPGATAIQAGDDRAPWLLLKPGLGVSVGFDDNPRQVANRQADAVTLLSPNMIVSVDSPRVQGLLTSSFDFRKYVRATDQDQLSANGAGYAFATIAPEHLYLDGRGSIFQVSPVGGAGFANPTLGTLIQPQTVLTTSVTPIYRQSFGDLVETDLRYNHSSLSPLGSLSQSGTPGATNTLAATENNQGTLTAALGRGGGVLASRVSLSATDIASQSDAASTQVRGVGELSYRITRGIAVISRGGYENLRYPVAGLAFTGPVLGIGARFDPTAGSVISVNYGRESGVWAPNAGFNITITPRTTLLGSYTHAINSRQEQILGNLNASRLDVYGTIVDAETALPLALANPEFGYSQDGVFRMQQARFALQHEFETDSVRLFAFYEKRTSLTLGTASDQARGAEIAWFRSMTPRLTGGVNLGYASHTSDRTVSLGASLTYSVRPGVDAVLNYQLQDLMSSAIQNPSYIRNILLAGVRASF
jgi:uncharacterized protein (PEP-CTERM system associated)